MAHNSIYRYTVANNIIRYTQSAFQETIIYHTFTHTIDILCDFFIL